MIENLEMERRMLGAAMLSEPARGFLERLNASDFVDTRHRVIASVSMR